jgi:hypothetical protein
MQNIFRSLILAAACFGLSYSSANAAEKKATENKPAATPAATLQVPTGPVTPLDVIMVDKQACYWTYAGQGWTSDDQTVVITVQRGKDAEGKELKDLVQIRMVKNGVLGVCKIYRKSWEQPANGPVISTWIAG